MDRRADKNNSEGNIYFFHMPDTVENPLQILAYFILVNYLNVDWRIEDNSSKS